ncbi:MAG: HAD hydrolase-like protein [Deltaproteobacteria bacterium]|nr:HAD hydrolase-like protein [Deltaproteobacteria bacterium]
MSIHDHKPHDAILFDLDGVLVDSRHAISQCLNHGLIELGLAPEPVEVLHSWIGASLHDVFRELLSARGVAPELTGSATRSSHRRRRPPSKGSPRRSKRSRRITGWPSRHRNRWNSRGRSSRASAWTSISRPS